MNKKYLGLFLGFSLAVMVPGTVYHEIKEYKNNKNILQTDKGNLEAFGDVKMKSCLKKGDLNKYDLTISKDGANLKSNLDSGHYNKSVNLYDKEFNRFRDYYEKYYKDDEIMVGVNTDYSNNGIRITYKKLGDKKSKEFLYIVNEKISPVSRIVSVTKKGEDILLIYNKSIDDNNFEINAGKIDFENSKVDLVTSKKFEVNLNNRGASITNFYTNNEKVYLYAGNEEDRAKFKVLNLKDYSLTDIEVNLPKECNKKVIRYFCDDNNMYILSCGPENENYESRISIVKFDFDKAKEDSFLLDPEQGDSEYNIFRGDFYVDGDKVYIAQTLNDPIPILNEDKVLIRILDFNKKELIYKGTVNEGRNDYVEFFK